MEWARDQLGNLIHASERGLFSYGLSCPTCQEPVRRRAGLERRPHFAHYSHSAKPECEYYYPSLHITGRQIPRTGAPRKQPPARDVRSPGGMFLEWSGGKASLYLKLPQLSIGTVNAGQLHIRSGLGERIYAASQLERPLFVPVMPRLPLAEVAASDELAVIAAVVTSGIARFRSSGNYFRMSDSGGRLLAPNEPFEWGEKYSLLTQHALPRIPVSLGVEVERKEERRGWFLYTVALPSRSFGTHTTLKAFIQYFGRTIKAPRPRVYFVEPPPHHIEPDGAHIFPEMTERIVLRRTGPSRITVEGADEAIVNELSDEWVALTGLGVGSFTVAVDRREELLGRIEQCDLFEPRGVRVIAGDSSWEIFELGLTQRIVERSHQGVRIECPNLHVAERVRLDPKIWHREDAHFTLVGLPPSNVDAENFGALFAPAAEKTNIPAPVRNRQAAARRAWLEGVVASRYGPDMLIHLRMQWDAGSSLYPDKQLFPELAWLQAHIRFARSV